jgi:hypothetical protein
MKKTLSLGGATCAVCMSAYVHQRVFVRHPFAFAGLAEGIMSSGRGH